jgi:twinkle protein
VASELLQDLDIKRIEARHITKATCEAYGYAIGKHNGKTVHVAPYYHKGTLCAQHLRDKDKGFSWLGKVQHLEMFGQRLFPAGSHPKLVITEGELDALSVAQVFGLKMPVVSIYSGSGSAEKSILHNLEWVNSFQEVVIAMDNDEAGEKAREAILPLLKPGTAKLMLYPDGFKDANEFLMKGEGPRLIDAVLKASRWSPGGIISGTTLFNDIMSEDQPGLATPYPGLNDKFMGLRKGELYLFTAGSGIGKSTLVNEIAFHFLMEHQQKIGVFALEENKKRLGRRYLSLHLNRPLHISMEGLTQYELEQAFKDTVGNGRFWMLDHWGSYDIDSLIGKLRYMAVGLGVDWIVLDHISIVVSGLDEVAESERKLIDKLMTKMRSLVEETGVGILAIVHLKRVDDAKSNFNEGKQVRLTDLRGSAALEQIPDGVIAAERNQQGDNPDVMTLRVLKNRPIGKTGVADQLLYHHDTGRLLPYDAHDPSFEPELF